LIAACATSLRAFMADLADAAASFVFVTTLSTSAFVALVRLASVSLMARWSSCVAVRT
jgi:hypothetical protein